MRVGFIGLGNVGGKPASSLLRNGFEPMVNDLQRSAAGQLLEGGAKWGGGRADGVLTGLSAGKIWLEMSSSNRQKCSG